MSLRGGLRTQVVGKGGSSKVKEFEFECLCLGYKRFGGRKLLMFES